MSIRETPVDAAENHALAESESFAEAALETHFAAARLSEGGDALEVWHLLLSLRAFCLARNIDFYRQLQTVEEEFAVIHDVELPEDQRLRRQRRFSANASA